MTDNAILQECNSARRKQVACRTSEFASCSLHFLRQNKWWESKIRLHSTLIGYGSLLVDGNETCSRLGNYFSPKEKNCG